MSFDMHNPSFRCLFPYFRAEFLTQNLSIQTTELRIYVAKWHVWLPIRGANKGQFGTLVEALNADLRAHDYEVLEKIAQITCLQGENDLFMR